MRKIHAMTLSIGLGLSLLAPAVSFAADKECANGWEAYVESLRSTLAKRGTMGFGYQSVVIAGGGLPVPRLVVEALAEDGPAKHAGLQVGDCIIGLDGAFESNLSAEAFDAAVDERLAKVRPGDVVQLKTVRLGKVSEVSVLAELPDKRQIDRMIWGFVVRHCGPEAARMFEERVRSGSNTP